MARKRESYSQRIERGVARGLSRSQARGHPRAGEPSIKTRTFPTAIDPKLEAALLSMRRGGTLAAVARERHVSRERLSAYIKANAGATRTGKQWTFSDRRPRRLPIFEAGDRPIIVVPGFEPAHIAGGHWNDALNTLADPTRRNVAAFQRRWRDARIRDASGAWHTLSTDLNEIARAAHAYDEPFDQIYKLIG